MKKLIILSICGVFFYLPNLFSQSKLPPCQNSKVFNNCYGERIIKEEIVTQKYLGEFQNDRFHGQGRIILFWNAIAKDVYEQPIKIEGIFAFGKRNGQVKTSFKNGDYDISYYNNDVAHGTSTLYKKGNKIHSIADYNFGKIKNITLFYDPPFLDIIKAEITYDLNSNVLKTKKIFVNGTTEITDQNDMTLADSQKILGISPYGEDKSFVYIILALLVFFVLFLVFKFNKSKKSSRKNKQIKITAKAYSQQNFSSFVFWNGQKGLALTFWGFFVGGNGLFNLVTVIFADNSTLLTFNLIFFVIWNVLSVMGVFNAADIYKSEKIKRGLSYTPAIAAKVAVVLLILSGIGNSLPK
jgi:hypothetical protein